MMKHLSEDELAALAEASSNLDLYSAAQIEYLNHLKDCTECYESFCRYLILFEATSEIGYSIMAESFESADINQTQDAIEDFVWASFKVTVRQIGNQLAAAISQLHQELEPLVFEPPFSLIRGAASVLSSASARLENLENDRTYIAYDAETGCLLVQIDPEDISSEHIRIMVRYPDGSIQNVEMEMEGTVLKGALSGLRETDFEIFIK